VYAVADVAHGFGLLPSSQLNVVVYDNVYIECKANKFVFSLPELYVVDSVYETQLTAGGGLEITHTM